CVIGGTPNIVCDVYETVNGEPDGAPAEIGPVNHLIPGLGTGAALSLEPAVSVGESMTWSYELIFAFDAMTANIHIQLVCDRCGAAQRQSSKSRRWKWYGICGRGMIPDVVAGACHPIARAPPGFGAAALRRHLDGRGARRCGALRRRLADAGQGLRKHAL